LQRCFDIHEPLNKGSAPAVWKAANERLEKDPDLSVRGIFRKFRVYAVGTTDDPADSLEWHKKIREAQKTGGEEGGFKPGAGTRVIPSFRPDRIIAVDREDFAPYIARLAAAAGRTAGNLEDLLAILRERLDLFDALGCRTADHGLESPPFALPGKGLSGEKEAAAAFSRALAGEVPTPPAAESYKTFLLNFLGAEYHDRGWVMQLHLAAIRAVNTRAVRAIGPDSGHDAVHDRPIAEKLARFLDLLESRDKLPKTILYSLNPRDYYVLGSVMGAFQGGIPGKMQLGSAWWFCDHRDGMEEQLRTLGNIGLLSRFVGMLTDSRSFLSYPRHEYFRRILCNLLGRWAEAGEIPPDPPLLKTLVRDISFGNAKRYFG
jgi:glucuronate isomerase